MFRVSIIKRFLPHHNLIISRHQLISCRQIRWIATLAMAMTIMLDFFRLLIWVVRVVDSLMHIGPALQELVVVSQFLLCASKVLLP